MFERALVLLALGLLLATCDNSYQEGDDDTFLPADDDDATAGDDDTTTADDDTNPADDDGDTVDPGPSQPVELAGAETEGCYAHVAAHAWDRVMVAWESDGIAIHYACYDGVSWTAAAPVHGDSGAENNPWLDVDSQGRFHLAWSHGLGSGGDISFISIRLGPDDSLHVVWCWGPDSDGHRVWYARKDPAGSWSAPARVTDDIPRFTEPSLDVDPQGYAHIVWTYCSEDGCDWDVEHGAIWYVRTTLEDLQGS